MTKYTSALLLLVIWSCTERKTPDRLSLMDQYLTGQATLFDFNGNVLVAEKGQIVFQRSLGLADYVTGRTLNDSSVFELASVSKQFTAMGVLLLEARGLLSTSDTLRKFFPELPYSNITLHQMLTHTSGLPDYMDLMMEKWDKSRVAQNQDVIDLLVREQPPVYFQPGEQWDYCNTAYMLLASIIERVSGQSFADYMNDNIFVPLGMKRTRIYNTRRSTGERIDNYAFGHVWQDSLQRYVLPDSVASLDFVRYLDGIQGDGIVNSTVADLLIWDRALLDKKILGSEPVEKLLSRHSLADTLSQGYYGYGIGVGEGDYGPYQEHSGGWPGYTTNLVRYHHPDVTIVVLSNNNSPSPMISGALMALLSGDSVDMPYKHVPATVDTSALQAFVGTYSFQGRQFDIVLRNDSLFQMNKTGQKYYLFPESPTKVFPDFHGDVQYELVADAAGGKTLYRIYCGVREKIQRME